MTAWLQNTNHRPVCLIHSCTIVQLPVLQHVKWGCYGVSVVTPQRSNCCKAVSLSHNRLCRHWQLVLTATMSSAWFQAQHILLRLSCYFKLGKEYGWPGFQIPGRICLASWSGLTIYRWIYRLQISIHSECIMLVVYMCVGWYITIAARSLSPTADSKNSTLVLVSYYVSYQLTGGEMCRHISTSTVHCKFI